MPLNILHLDTEYGWRGGQQQLAYLAAGLLKRGVDNTVVCQPGSEMAEFCRTNGIPCRSLRMHGEMDLAAGFKIARICRQKKIGLLHLHSGHAVTLGLWAKLLHRRLTLIATRRVDFRLRSGGLSRLKYVNPLLDRIVCVSEEIERIMVSEGVPATRLCTIHSGVDLSKYADHVPPADFRSRWGMGEGAFVVGTVAAMVGHKDYPTLLRAVRLVADRNPKIIFCAVGDGPLEKEIRDLADELNLGRRFIFTGYQRNVGDFLKSFDLFVLSSNQEGLGTSVLDAQAAGIPVVACASGGIPEMIRDGMNGRLVPKETPEALAQAILELAGDGPMRRGFAAAALKSVRQFSVEKTVDRYIELYQSL